LPHLIEFPGAIWQHPISDILIEIFSTRRYCRTTMRIIGVKRQYICFNCVLASDLIVMQYDPGTLIVGNASELLIEELRISNV
jgi:hypothetical protein